MGLEEGDYALIKVKIYRHVSTDRDGSRKFEINVPPGHYKNNPFPVTVVVREELLIEVKE